MRPTSRSSGERGELALPSAPDDGGLLRAFRNDPVNNKLPTPSGKIEIHSKAIAGFGYDDCPPHPAWLPSTEPPDARHPLTLIANQPATRLHSQLDFGAYSQSEKSPAANPSVSTLPTPRAAASPMATSSACSTIAARAWPPPS